VSSFQCKHQTFNCYWALCSVIVVEHPFWGHHANQHNLWATVGIPSRHFGMRYAEHRSRRLRSPKITTIRLQNVGLHIIQAEATSRPTNRPSSHRLHPLAMSQILPVPNPTPSYWLSEPHRFSNLRSTPDLPSKCDIAIIGSGLSGVATAYHILQESDPANVPNVVILEARDLCSGATARNGGHSKIKINTLTGLLGKMGPKGVKDVLNYVHGIARGLEKIVDEEGLECEFEIRRTMDVFLDIGEAEALKEVYENSWKKAEEWTKSFRWVPAEHVEQVTSIKGAVAAASSPAVSFWPYKFVTQLLARMVERYPSPVLNVQTNTPVTSVGVSNRWNVLSTPRGVLLAKKVVFATNAYTAGLLPQFEDVIVPMRGTASHITPSVPVHPHLSNTYNINFGQGKSVDYLNRSRGCRTPLQGQPRPLVQQFR
jgi:hypothetical protein